jgi:hypothetical protein
VGPEFQPQYQKNKKGWNILLVFFSTGLIAQTVLELMILVPLAPEHWNLQVCRPHLAGHNLFKEHNIQLSYWNYQVKISGSRNLCSELHG